MKTFEYNRIYSEEIKILRASYEKGVERQRILDKALKDLNEISWSFEEDLQTDRQGCERQWNFPEKNRRQSKCSAKISREKAEFADLNQTTSTIGSTNSIAISIPNINATTTGPTSTILPTNLPNNSEYSSNDTDTDTDSTVNNDEYEDDSENFIDSDYFIYEEEDVDEYSMEDDFLNVEDYQFADSINNTSFTRIYLPSVFGTSYDSSVPSTPILATVHDSKFTKLIFSSEIFSGLTVSLLLNIFNFNISVNVYNFNRYKILIWDPGILYTI